MSIMPGIMYHLYVAKLVSKKCYITGHNRKIFMGSNLIPDYTNNKRRAHLYKEEISPLFQVPNLEALQKELDYQNDLIHFGIYSHLYTDYCFITRYLAPRFQVKGDTIRTEDTSWSSEHFFSEKGLYGAYTTINHRLQHDNLVSMKLVNAIPRILPKTNLERWQNHSATSWKKELKVYLEEPDPNVEDVLEYDKLLKCLQTIAEDLSNVWKS